MFALPNLVLREAIEADGFALAPAHDDRIVEMARTRTAFGSFMGRFKTEFGDEIEPSVIIWRDDMPNSYRTISAISGFRDLISMCVIPLAWAQVLRFGPRQVALYSDYFSVYPWMTDNKDEGIITRTPAMLGVHEVRLLQASSIAALSLHILEHRDIDRPMLKELLRLWVRCFATDTPTPEDERLFRSLNMANAAAMLPLGADSKLYDALRSVALWVSAFEILKPAKNMALTAYIDLKFVRTKPKTEGTTEYDAYWEDHYEFGHFQSDIEAALSTVVLTEEEYRQQRTRLPARRPATLTAP